MENTQFDALFMREEKVATTKLQTQKLELKIKFMISRKILYLMEARVQILMGTNYRSGGTLVMAVHLPKRSKPNHTAKQANIVLVSPFQMKMGSKTRLPKQSS